MTETCLSRIYTIEQKRAQKAYNVALPSKEYRAGVRQLAPMIVNNGLLQALTFFKAKRTDVYNSIMGYLDEWLNEHGLRAGQEFIQRVAGLTVTDYRAATAEALAFTTWLKRFAEAKGIDSAQRVPGAVEASGQTSETAVYGGSDA